jgi:hypothetical protein
MASARHPVLHLFGRHPNFGHHGKTGRAALENHPGGFGSRGHASQQRKVSAVSISKYYPFGVCVGLKEWLSPSYTRKIKKCQERFRKVADQVGHKLSKIGGNFGSGQILFDCNPSAEGLQFSLTAWCSFCETTKEKIGITWQLFQKH